MSGKQYGHRTVQLLHGCGRIFECFYRSYGTDTVTVRTVPFPTHTKTALIINKE